MQQDLFSPWAEGMAENISLLPSSSIHPQAGLDAFPPRGNTAVALLLHELVLGVII